MCGLEVHVKEQHKNDGECENTPVHEGRRKCQAGSWTFAEMLVDEAFQAADGHNVVQL